MTMTVGDVCLAMEELAPLSWQESYDNAGLQLGNPACALRGGILVCLDVSEAVIEEALACDCQMIVSHHPLIFRGLKHLTEATAVERCVSKAIRNQLAVYSAHTNLDAVCRGVSAKMCEKLGLQPAGFLAPKDLSAQAGLGMIADLPQACGEEGFLQLVKRTFRSACLRHSALTGRSIRRVALCGGAGAEFIPQALAAGADAYVTADLKYHDFGQPDGRLLLIDAGHFETEQYTKEIIHNLLSEKFPNFAVRISQAEKNPVCYF
ncbi:MAG: Nif3-like dinuclear metal center hexameric protein [Bacteroidales bacterium]|nr:Nif3-like dinuclear metal center hexameric protein [Bacteroidales bacterium]